VPSLNQCNRAEGTVKQRAFVRYLFDVNNPRTFGNGTQSARKARYKGNSDQLAVVAYQNIRKLQVMKMAESLVQSILSTDGVEQEITSIATTKTEVDGAMRMKALDLLTKIKGMQVQKVETVDLTERDATATALSAHIESVALSEAVSLDTAAVGLFTRLSATKHPTLSDPRNWGKWATVIEAHLKAEAEPAVIDGGNA
jgi:hypothetical protein